MQEFIFNYYGIDWIAMVFTFTCLYLVAQKNKYGFLAGVFAGILWIIYGFLAESAAQIISNIIFTILNLRGFLKWSKEEKINLNK